MVRTIIGKTLSAIQKYYRGKIYIRYRSKDYLRISLRRYRRKEEQLKDLIRCYNNIRVGKLINLYNYSFIALVYSKGAWFLEFKVSTKEWVEKTMKENGYRHKMECTPEICVIRNNAKLPLDPDERLKYEHLY